MPNDIPRELMELLERLGLAEAGAIRAVEGRVRRLGRELPQFQSIWVDALVQARLLSPYQATEINAGRGANLRLGSYVLKTKVSSLGYARRFAARHVESGDCAELIAIDGLGKSQDDDAIDSLAAYSTLAIHGSTSGDGAVQSCRNNLATSQPK